MVWEGKRLGLKFTNLGNAEKPKIKLEIYSKEKLREEFLRRLTPEIRWRFNFDQDISDFCRKYEKDKFLAPLISKWKGVKPIAANSLYESLMIYIVLQNASVRRSVQMLEALFENFGKKLKFDRKVLSAFWEPRKILKAGERKLRELKLGYRAKFILKISEQFSSGYLEEEKLRSMKKDDLKKELLKLYGIGPASLEYLLFEDFYFLNSLETLPPWERKIMSRLLFGRLVSEKRILNFFKRYRGYEKLAFHYFWEDLFWGNKKEKIEWLEKEIRL